MLKQGRTSFWLFMAGIFFGVSQSSGAASLPTDQAELDGSEPAAKISGLDPDDPPETSNQLTPSLSFGGQLEIESIFQTNLDLDGATEDDFSASEPGASLAFFFDPGRYLQAFIDVTLSKELFFEDPDQNEDQTKLESEQAYVLFKNLLNERLALQLGRQRFEDERQWLYDEELDAVRAFFRFSRLLVELSASQGGLVDRDLLNNDEEEQTNNYIAYGTYSIAEELNAGAYVVVRDDRSAEEDSPILFGIHSGGELTDALEYWLEAAYARGRNDSAEVEGYGFDLGSKFEFDLPLAPSITFGYAFGTGDGDPDNDVDRSFRQTGLQNNEDDFKYYGELFDPELSNLAIFTVGAGTTPTEQSYVDLVYHDYRQHKAADSLRDAGIDAVPNGKSKDLGSELNLILGYEHRRLELALNLGYFMPGQAFAPAFEPSFLARFEAQFGF
ncbi:MAG: alginate export family protein [Gammaproteobacteria bacterium]